MGSAHLRTASVHPVPIVEFERMLAELSAGFINLQAAEVDGAINDALRRITELISADRGRLISFSEDSDSASTTHSAALGNVPAIPPRSLSKRFPWVLSRLREGNPVVIHDVAALPAAAAVDRASFEGIGTRANLSVPLRVGGRIEGALAFGCVHTTQDWPDALIARVGVLAEVFANALAHKRAQEALDAAMRFEQLVSQILAALLTAAGHERDHVIEAGLRDVARTFGADHAILWQRVADADDFTMTHGWLAEAVANLPKTVHGNRIPWIHSQVMAGIIVRFGHDVDLPPEAGAELTVLAGVGIQTGVFVPVTVSGNVVGALSLSSANAQLTWTDALIARLTLLGDVFAGMLAREASERREQEAQAQAAHAARVGTLGMFAASLIHELTQPLAASLANAETAAELLVASSPDLTELRSVLDDIVADDRRVGELIQQLRRFLRRGEAERVELDIEDVINDNLRMVAGDAAEKDVAVTLDVAQPLPTLVGERVQLQQVMLNLLINAFDAVASREAGSRKVDVVVRAIDNGISVEVSDSGTGMDESTLVRIFQPFFTTKPKGMGLGLSISRSIVAAHGGRLSARSAPNEGTTFRIELPSRPRAATHAAPRNVAVVAGTGNVYVVDDDLSMRRAIERQLRTAGYRVTSFSSVQAFLDASPDRSMACVVSDVRMPGLSGLDLQASLAKAQSDLPIVFISGHGDVATTVRALKSGAVNFLAKPFTKTALLNAVAEALAQSRDLNAQRDKTASLKARHSTLTPREREVLALVAAGMLNKLIADRLGAAEATIKIHRGRVMEKMGAASVADLVRMVEALSVASPLPKSGPFDGV